MLADNPPIPQSGNLAPIHRHGEARYALLDFIAQELPRWRDDPDREVVSSETVLTDQLCNHLNSAARVAEWSHVQFRTEVPDEAEPSRRIDLAAKPCGVVFIIEGQKYTHHNSLIPIECKRLPMPEPQSSRRDEREYVVTHPGTTGGIQRFKFGHHGAAHRLAGMIGYIQDQTATHWHGQVNEWISDLVKDMNSGWSAADALELLVHDVPTDAYQLRSRHQRSNDLEEIELRHLWIQMN